MASLFASALYSHSCRIITHLSDLRRWSARLSEGQLRRPHFAQWERNSIDSAGDTLLICIQVRVICFDGVQVRIANFQVVFLILLYFSRADDDVFCCDTRRTLRINSARATS